MERFFFYRGVRFFLQWAFFFLWVSDLYNGRFSSSGFSFCTVSNFPTWVVDHTVGVWQLFLGVLAFDFWAFLATVYGAICAFTLRLSVLQLLS
jgi:hypothetical protein